MWEFELWQGGVMVAGGSGPSEKDVRREAMHYAAQYAQDGDVMLKIGPAPISPTSHRR